LGEREEDIIERLNKVILQLIEHEENARQMLLQKRSNTLFDHIGRGYGILRHAFSLSSKEGLNLLSFIKLGIDLGFFPEKGRQTIDELFMETQPAHLQKGSQQKLAADERDAVRAQLIRERLAEFPKPNLGAAMDPGGKPGAS
jgi:protein arginine kinase